ncbi:MAG: winged helix-turn-helix domain-containing protein [Acidimicrobiales bacterium]|nr:winged helix-turn-helix domain-containing protein [Acidimicrobiales bacterium]
MRYHFGRFTIDTDTVELLDDGHPVDMEPQAFAVLTHLIEQRHRVVPKEELLDTVWGDRFVTASALTTQIKQCRRVVGDDGEAQRFIRTAHRVGYRFAAEVTVEDPDAEPTGSTPSRTSWSPAAPLWNGASGTSLFGREGDLTRLVDRITNHRLVTITGTGGVGKTSLATLLLDVAPSALGITDHHLCALGATRTPHALANVVLGALGEGQQGDAEPAESIMRILGDREALLVLDCCEHVVEEAARFATELIHRCPGVRVVATSRRPLEVPGESLLVLEPLSHRDAAACFRARAADAGMDLPADDPALDELVDRLDGIPLAIELAAARTRLLSPDEMLRLLDDRFRLLRTTGPDDTGNLDDADAARHASLHRTIAWSWDALDDHDRELLAQLSVFVGTFSLDDVAAVALPGADPFDVIESMERLLSNSLVVATTGSDARTRFHLLDSIREFAAAQLADPVGSKHRHVVHFAVLTERLDAAFQTPAIDEALRSSHAAWPNLRAAVGYAHEDGDTTSIRRIVAAIGDYAELFQLFELLRWCDQADLGDRPTDGLAADALAVWARMLAHRGEWDRARQLAEMARDAHESHATVLATMWCDYYQGHLDRVVADAGRLADLSRGEIGMERGFADGFVAIAAAVRQEPVLETTDVRPDRAQHGVLGVFDCLFAGLQLCAADPQRASELLEAVVIASLRHDYRLLLGAAASTLTQITLPGQPREKAARTLCRTLERYRERGMWMLISADTMMAARLLADHGDTDTASRLLGSRRATGYRTGISELIRTQLEDELVQRIGQRRYEQLSDQGAAWNPTQAAGVAIDGLRRHLVADDGSEGDGSEDAGDGVAETPPAQAGLRARKV